ncbi:SOS response-associated peptidase [soil metagenome]
MCGRFVVAGTEAGIVERFRVDVISNHIQNGFNLAPSMRLPVIAENKEGQRELRAMTWGLKKIWWKPGGTPPPINARAEGIESKPTFRDSLKNRRCVVPASGYYEWSGEKGKKQPYFIHLKDEPVFGFAGLWDAFKSDLDEWVISFAIITTTPAESIAAIHNRMPVILHAEDESKWLDRDLNDPSEVLPFLKSYDSDALDAYPVSTRVGSVANNDPSLIDPITSDD